MRNHYVPQFILKKYGEKLSFYDVKEKKLVENSLPENIFVSNNIYSDKIETDLCKQIESPFSILLEDKILKSQDELVITRDELTLIKKFLLLSLLRTLDGEKFMEEEKDYYKKLKSFLLDKGIEESEINNYSMPTFTEKIVPDETNHQYWMRTLESAVKLTSFDPICIAQIDNITYVTYHWARVINAGYLGIWDSDDKEDFVITDVGMTSENEVGCDNRSVFNHKKIDYVNSLCNRFWRLANDTSEKPENRDQYNLFSHSLFKQMQFISEFNENFMMFPISSKRMLVLICPFFRVLNSIKEAKDLLPDIADYTLLTNGKLFEPNEVKKHNQDDSTHSFDPDDEFIYKIVKLNSKETQYCNCLFLDRIERFVGFSSLDKVKESFLSYKEKGKDLKLRTDYDKIYSTIQERYKH